MAKRRDSRTASTKGDVGPSVAGGFYQIKVVLKDIEPPVWRRLLVSTDTTLDRLHRVLQVAMGWQDCHLHQFLAGGEVYGAPSPDAEYVDQDERKHTLADVAGDGGRVVYEYDFGDDWEHDVIVEKVVVPEKGVSYPVCVGGERACPPEDCGGLPGYEHLLEVLADPDHDEHEDLKEWVGGSFDAEGFDVQNVNAALAQLAKRRTSGRR